MKTAVCRIWSNQNLEKEKKSVKTLAAIIKQARKDHKVAIEN